MEVEHFICGHCGAEIEGGCDTNYNLSHDAICCQECDTWHEFTDEELYGEQ